MPVSRKRKTKTNRRRSSSKQTSAARDLLDVLDGAGRVRTRRVELGRPVADALIGELAAGAATRDQDALQDELCARLGPVLHELVQRPVEQYVGAEDFAVSLVGSAAAAVKAALLGGEPVAAAWKILDTTLSTVPVGLIERMGTPVDDLRRLPGGGGLPALTEVAPATGDVRWARDRYGSRIAVLARFGERWYLWDIDVCTYRPITVHSGFHSSPAEALDAWRAGVGDFAAGDAEWAGIDDGLLLESILPRVEGLLAVGAETIAQHAEYFRSRRLAEALLDDASSYPVRPAVPGRPDAADFVAWQRNRPAEAAPDDLDDLAEALAEIWPADVSELYHCCSPHRVAHVRLICGEEFEAGYADRVAALLPDWVTWLADRAGTPADLLQHALPYAAGEIHPALGDVPRLADYQARVIE
ncbi:hypothetical protein [Actinoplanes sp. M2I2]|uniref:hypothetical protein n=1 Tax=Actinoplanes sp. M2I2 TaxID=1734444 RepID=UPI002020A908|nr:hypothetical protein [Actinoplanes sp. M2I2]